MTSTHRYVGLAAVAGGIGALVAFALTPATAAALGHIQAPRSNLVAAQTRTSSTAAPSAACTDAQQARTAGNTKDKAEDGLEKAGAKTAGASTVDTGEDSAEKAARKTLKDAVRAACTTPACVSAEQAVKDAKTKDTAEDKTEKTTSTEKSTGDQKEDATEKAAQKTLKTTKRTACSSSGK